MYVKPPRSQERENTAIYNLQGFSKIMLENLPKHLRERLRLANQYEELTSDGPVIVWLKSALRTHENPAIDLGRIIAARNHRPLLIYQAIDERYPHASLRHHNMLLDGAQDLHDGCQSLGLRYVLHVARMGNRQPVMKHFSVIASCIITDLQPLSPWIDWVKNIAKVADCPVVEVDCHCVIPIPMFGKSVDRPYKFRDATKKIRTRLKHQTWPKVEVLPQAFEGALPFVPIDFEQQISEPKKRIELLKDCRINPTVFPVWQERGGEKASLLRWQRFLDKGLSGYSKRRNNAADHQGVSRLSAAFHYGFLSPMKVVREALEVGTKSADKYVDELLTFREHAWHHVAGVENAYCSSNLPFWALESWNNTSNDVRTVLLASHQLEYSRSPNNLWNLCQKSLVKHGELHNNLRMTWGKAIPQWTTSLEVSLTEAQKLNDKYALDGRDPSSVVGIQWCHGLFDRPFYPSIPVMGVVRKRDLATHESRLDLTSYAQHINRKTGLKKSAILVIGDALTDAYIARVLHDNGVMVFHQNYQNPRPQKPTNRLLQEYQDELPNFIFERLKSISEKLRTNDFSLIAADLLRGVPKLSSTIVETDELVGESKTYIKFNNIHYQLSAICSSEIARIGDLPKLQGLDIDHITQCEIGQKDTSDDIVHALLPCLWQVAELIWQFSAVAITPQYYSQAKLI